MATKEEQRLAAIAAAKDRRTRAAAEKVVRIESFIEKVSTQVKRTLKQRVQMATELVKNRVVLNISRPVTKIVVTKITGKQATLVSDRSKPGEFPKADTTLLMKTIFSEVREIKPGYVLGYVGTPLDYGVRLEIQMDRAFLARTLWEEQDKIIAIMSGPIR